MSRVRRAMVLAAGCGTRLRPLTDETPKALVPFGGEPMIHRSIRWLARSGIEEIVVNVHHFGDRIRDALGNGDFFGVEIHYSVEDHLLDTGGGLARARRFLDGEPFAVVNCDASHDISFEGLVESHLEHRALATLALREDPNAARYGLVETNAVGRIRRFLGRPPSGERLAPRMFCGVQLLEPDIFSSMPTRPVFSLTKDVYAPLVEEGARMFGYLHRGLWRDLGTPESLAAAEAELSAKRDR